LWHSAMAYINLSVPCLMKTIISLVVAVAFALGISSCSSPYTGELPPHLKALCAGVPAESAPQVEQTVRKVMGNRASLSLAPVDAHGNLWGEDSFDLLRGIPLKRAKECLKFALQSLKTPYYLHKKPIHHVWYTGSTEHKGGVITHTTFSGAKRIGVWKHRGEVYFAVGEEVVPITRYQGVTNWASAQPAPGYFSKNVKFVLIPASAMPRNIPKKEKEKKGPAFPEPFPLARL